MRGAALAGVTLLAMAMPPASAPVAAQGKALGCMAGAYTGEQDARLDALADEAGFAGESDEADGELAGIVMQAVESCVDGNGWTQEEAMYAAFYELGRVSEAAYRNSGELSEAQLGNVDEALAKGDRSRLWGIIERGLMNGMASGDGNSGISGGDAMTLGAFVTGTGIGSDEATAEKVGVLLGFMALQRLGRREFQGLQGE
ncbi:hypothetical protein [Aurantiacibacter spongiae]|uniref:Uncharacterized protein n=1 Tax=Aurantiacibacter spongiae TaxID=2488860 RepID=A0A3N5CNQ0_9SPHN|nr:hypothetical protein [Aurantiacibacter spongiae]RPF70583.1 hypothetical protein EG799_02300 [Aurantiacibacter spongiae]